MRKYEKQNFVPGQILKASELNYIEDGIEAIESKILTEAEINELIDAKMARLVNVKEVEY